MTMKTIIANHRRKTCYLAITLCEKFFIQNLEVLYVLVSPA